MLTGQLKSAKDLPEDDWRRHTPRFQPGNLEINIKLAEKVEKLAAKKNCTPAQLAISWVAALSNRNGLPTIIPIPGASSAERVLENAKFIELTEEDMKEIDQMLESFEVAGDRYPPALMKYSYR
jgi:pyridoxine 4-dehydrogenase